MKYQCVGGHTFRVTDFPSRERFRIYDESELDRIVERILSAYDSARSAREEFADALEEIFFSSTEERVQPIECPICHRLMVLAGARLEFSYQRDDLDSLQPADKDTSLYNLFQRLAQGQKNKIKGVEGSGVVDVPQGSK